MSTEKAFGRSTKYVVLPVETVRAFNIRSEKEVMSAQSRVNKDMLSALEGMIKAARAGQLEGSTALMQEAVAW